MCIYQALTLLSEESLGTRLLSQCTTGGSGEVHVLPNDGLNLLNFLEYWSNPEEFEAMAAINTFAYCTRVLAI